MQTAHDLLLPSGIHVLVKGWIQTGDQISSQYGPFVYRARQEPFAAIHGASWVMFKIMSPSATWLGANPVGRFDQQKFLPQQH